MPVSTTLRPSRVFAGSLLALTFAASLALADTYAIHSSNFAGSGNFGTVTTTLVGSSIQVDVALAPGYILHTAGVGFNVVDPDAGVAESAFSAHFSTGATASAFDGFGKFEFSAVSDETPASARANGTSTASFKVSRTGGFTNANQLAEVSTKGWYFAMQVAPIDPNAATGFFAVGPSDLVTATSGATWGRIKALFR